MLPEGSSVKESPEDKQGSTPYIRGSAKISRQVNLALHTGFIPDHQLRSQFKSTQFKSSAMNFWASILNFF